MPNVLSTLRQDHLNELPVEILLKIFSKMDGPPYWPTLLLVCKGWGELIQDSKNVKDLEGIRPPIKEMALNLEVSKYISTAAVVLKQRRGYAMKPIREFESPVLTLNYEFVVRESWFEYIEESLRIYDIANFTLNSPRFFNEAFLIRLCEALECCPLLSRISFQWFPSPEGNLSNETLCRFARTTGSISNCPPFMINDDFLKAKAEGRGGHDMKLTAGSAINKRFQPINAENLLCFNEFTSIFTVSSLAQLIEVAKRRNGPLHWMLSITEDASEIRRIPKMRELNRRGLPPRFVMGKSKRNVRVWVEFNGARNEAILSKE